MMKKALATFTRVLPLAFPFSSSSKITDQRYSLIKNHTIVSEYEVPSV
jgi:hypothetical protein